jgi:hypothetical protein
MSRVSSARRRRLQAAMSFAYVFGCSRAFWDGWIYDGWIMKNGFMTYDFRKIDF